MASTDITQLPGWTGAKDITTLLAAGALTITKAQVYKFGSNIIVQFTYSDASTGYVKFKSTGPRFSVGGADNTFASGTEILWQS